MRKSPQGSLDSAGVTNLMVANQSFSLLFGKKTNVFINSFIAFCQILKVLAEKCLF